MKTKALTELIRSRRSVFPNTYMDKTIERETIELILENANWAPTHRKTQPWRFKVFTGESLQRLSDYLGNYYEQNTSEEKYSEVKLKKTRKKPIQSGAVIAICMRRTTEVNIPEWEEIAAVSCAVQNMWLTCSSLGIGAYWSSPTSITEATDFLHLSDNERCLGLFYMGYESEIKLTSTRDNIKDKTEWM